MEALDAESRSLPLWATLADPIRRTSATTRRIVRTCALVGLIQDGEASGQ